MNQISEMNTNNEAGNAREKTVIRTSIIGIIANEFLAGFCNQNNPLLFFIEDTYSVAL